MLDKEYEVVAVGGIEMSRKTYNKVVDLARTVYPNGFYISICCETGHILGNVTKALSMKSYWSNLTSKNNRDFEVSKCWITKVSSKALLSDLQLKPKQADFFDELADLLEKHSASIASNSNINVQIKGRTIPIRGIKGKWYGRDLVTGKCLSARTIRKFRLRSGVV